MMDNIEIKKRTIPDRLRYMAKELNDLMGCNIQAMAMSLEMTADEMEKTEAADRAIRDLEKTDDYVLEVFKTKILKDFARWYNEHKSEFDAEPDMFVIVSRYQESTNEI